MRYCVFNAVYIRVNARLMQCVCNKNIYIGVHYWMFNAVYYQGITARFLTQYISVHHCTFVTARVTQCIYQSVTVQHNIYQCITGRLTQYLTALLHV